MQTPHRKVPETLDCPVTTSIFFNSRTNELFVSFDFFFFFLLIFCDNNVSLLGLKTGGQTKKKKKED